MASLRLLAQLLFLSWGVQASSFLQSWAAPPVREAAASAAASGLAALAAPAAGEAPPGASLLGLAGAPLPSLPALQQSWQQLAAAPQLPQLQQLPQAPAQSLLQLQQGINQPFSLLAQSADAERDQFTKVASGIQWVSDMARASISTAAQSQQQVQLLQQQLQQAQALQQSSELRAAAAEAEAAKVKQYAQEQASKAQTEEQQVKATQAELAKKSEELEGTKAKLLQVEDVAERALAAERALEGRSKQAEATVALARRHAAEVEQRSLQELRRARAGLQQAQLQMQQTAAVQTEEPLAHMAATAESPEQLSAEAQQLLQALSSQTGLGQATTGLATAPAAV